MNQQLKAAYQAGLIAGIKAVKSRKTVEDMMLDMAAALHNEADAARVARDQRHPIEFYEQMNADIQQRATELIDSVTAAINILSSREMGQWTSNGKPPEDYTAKEIAYFEQAAKKIEDAL